MVGADFDGGDELIQRHANIVIGAISRHVRPVLRLGRQHGDALVDQISPHTEVAKYYLISKDPTPQLTSMTLPGFIILADRRPFDRAMRSISTSER